jgi:hypothetical protein
MTFEIDEEKLKLEHQKHERVETKLSGEKVFDFFETVWQIVLWILGSAVVIAGIIFVGGAILGIMLFGWRQL